MITIIDYGMGNVFSVQNALKAIGKQAVISSRPEDIKKAERIILPGVGAFPDGMKNLEKSGLVEVLRKEALEKKKPFLGICLGMQLLGSVGEEHQVTAGLGWIPGRVRRFRVDEKQFRIPHIGWNEVAAKDSLLFREIKNPIFYFVHSYHLAPEDPAAVIATCDYGEMFAAAVQKENIFGVQFHPEKSQKEGLKILENFLNFKS